MDYDEVIKTLTDNGLIDIVMDNEILDGIKDIDVKQLFKSIKREYKLNQIIDDKCMEM